MPSITTGDLANAKVDVDHIGDIATSPSLTATDRLGHTKNTMAGAIATISAITNRGAWASAQTYVVKDMVSNAGAWYICVDPHTSGATFAGDVAHWRVYQGVLAADMAASTGGWLLGWIQAGVGAVFRWIGDKLRDFVNIKDFGGTGDGVTSNVAFFQACMTRAAALGGAVVKIPAGTYYFNITGDSDTILIPSNTVLDCESGVVFKWGYWGSPLFAIINKQNAGIRGNPKFLWTGTFGTTSGARDAFSFGAAIPAYEWCAHIAICGSDYTTIDGASCEGSTTSNVQNVFILLRGKNDLVTTAVGNKIHNIFGQDICLCLGTSGQSFFSYKNINVNRLNGASTALYGPPHAIYTFVDVVSKWGEIDGVIDSGVTVSSFANMSQTLSIKYMEDSVVTNIQSRRESGILNVNKCARVKFSNFDWHSSGTDDDINSGAVFFSSSGVATNNSDLDFDNFTLTSTGNRDFGLFVMAGMAAGTEMVRPTISNLKLTRNEQGRYATPSVSFVGSNGSLEAKYTNIGAVDKTVLNVQHTGSDRNTFRLKTQGASTCNPNIFVTAGNNNKFIFNPDSNWSYDSLEFTPSSGNVVIVEGVPQYMSRRVLGTLANPTGTFTLPKPGAYLVHLNLITTDFNHALSGLYWVVFDDASANDFTTAQLIGTQITKGGVPPTVLGLTVSNVGVCTFTSTAPNNGWVLYYGYKQLSAG